MSGRQGMSIADKIGLTVFLIIMMLAIIHFGHLENRIINTLLQPATTTTATTTPAQNTEKPITLVVNKTIQEWKKIYRDYIIYSDKMLRKHNAVGLDYNLSHLLQIIENANSSVIIRKFYFYDDVIEKYVVLEVVIPSFVVKLHINGMPQWGTDPTIKAIADTLKKYVKEYPSNYTGYRLALMILKIASQIHYRWEPRSYDPLLEIVYNEGNCGTKSDLAVELATEAGLWSAYIEVKACKANGFTSNHECVAIAIDNPPPWLKGDFNFTWHNHTFYIAELSAGYQPLFPIKPYPCSYVGAIVAPYWQKIYDIDKPLW